jgi:hypothetical protein
MASEKTDPFLRVDINEFDGFPKTPRTIEAPMSPTVE